MMQKYRYLSQAKYIKIIILILIGLERYPSRISRYPKSGSEFPGYNIWLVPVYLQYDTISYYHHG